MHLLPFLVVAVVVVITPAVDMALVTKNALVHGRNAALASALGVNVGIALWTIAAALGVAAVVQASAVAFAAIKFAGAIYLIYLGLQALRAGRQRAGLQASLPVGPLTATAAFRQGLVSNALNPKIAVFFTSLLPQFVAHGSSSLLDLLALGGLFNVLGVVWLSGYALVASRGGSLLKRPRVKTALDYVSGMVFVGLGVRLALERRT
jgi:threonine/homoserine/homoserine lactone efflux protein